MYVLKAPRRDSRVAMIFVVVSSSREAAGIVPGSKVLGRGTRNKGKKNTERE
jgi:hypothetical protein